MFKFIHAADIHLDSPLVKLDHYEGAPVEDLRQATRRALENMVELALREEVDFILISGDLYDGDWKDYNTGLYFTSQMARLREADISVYIVAGNHDAASKMTKALRPPGNVHFFSSDRPESVRLETLGAAIHGQSFPTPSVKKDLSAGYPEALSDYFNIGLLHTCLTGREGHEPYAPCTVEGLRSKGYEYWALGHVHQKEIHEGNEWIVFPGNLQGRHIRETGPKGCILTQVDDVGRADVQFHPLNLLQWERCRVDASDTSSPEDILDRVGQELETFLEAAEGLPLVVRVELIGRDPAHCDPAAEPERWLNDVRAAAIEAGGGRIWVEKIKFRFREPWEERPAEVPDGPVGELMRLLDEIRSDEDQLHLLRKSLKDLHHKLPKELKEGDDAIAVDDPEWLASVLEEVRPLLLHRLMAQRSHP